MKSSRKNGWLAAAVALGLMGASSAGAVPALQLTILDGYYDECPNETTCADDKSFTLVALLDPFASKIDPTEKFFVSAALSPKTDQGGDYGSFAWQGSPVDVTGDMTYGTPPIDEIYDAMYGDLGGHGIFETFFSEFEFQFDPSKKTAVINVQDETPEAGNFPDVPTGGFKNGDPYLLYALFTVDVALLEGDLNSIHFDLYSKVKKEIQVDYIDTNGRSKKKKEIVWQIEKFAPFSHDANSTTGGGGPPVNVPEPASLALLGIGLVGVGLARRRRLAA